MWIKYKIVDGVVVARFTSATITGEEMIQQAGREIIDLVDVAAENKKKLLLNFQGIQVMSSAMIGKLVLLNKLSRSCGVQLRFSDIHPNVLEVFKITRLYKVFRIIEDYDKEDWKDDDDDDDDSGNTGVFAKLPKHPSSGGAHAKPPRDA